MLVALDILLREVYLKILNSVYIIYKDYYLAIYLLIMRYNLLLLLADSICVYILTTAGVHI
jgi:hypothetical protein